MGQVHRGEVRIYDLDHALMLKRRDYIVSPEVEDETVQEKFRKGCSTPYGRHSRVGRPDVHGFVEDVEWLRRQGAKQVFLKIGAYNPAVTAFAVKCACLAKIDVLIFDGADRWTGPPMAP